MYAAQREKVPSLRQTVKFGRDMALGIVQILYLDQGAGIADSAPASV
jgi:hypothetical protein